MKNETPNTIPFKRHLISLVCVAIITAGTTYKLTEIYQERSQEQVTKKYAHSGDLDKLTASYETIINQYVGDYDKNKLIDGAIKGMTSALDDPYSEYFSGIESEQLNETIDGSFEGIGAVMTEENEVLKIAEPPIKNSPAEKAKLKVNDLVLKVDNQEIKGEGLTETVKKIRGKKGTEVTLTIQRETETFDVTIIRDTIPIETVFTDIDPKEKSVGKLRISTFSQHTAEEFKAGITDLRQKGATSFVIDVRQNPGGLLDQVAIISSMFLKDGEIIVKFEDKEKNKEQLKASKKLDDGFKVKEPTVVLANENSASASEILAAALHESAGIEIIGTKTFGKGTVQSVNPITPDSNLKLTTNKWLTPKGDWIHKKGFEPSIKLEYPDYYEAKPIDMTQAYQIGSEGAKIENIHLILSALDYQVDQKSDKYSEETVAAVKAFQKSEKIEETGIIDKQTGTLLQVALYNKMMANDTFYERAVTELTK